MDKKLSLQVKLILAICISMIPMNLLLIYTSTSAVKNVEERLFDSYRNELVVLQTRMNGSLESLSRELDITVKSPWTELTNPDKLGMLDQQNLIVKLRDIWQKIDLIEGGYLKLNRLGYVDITYNSELISLKEKESIAQMLADTDLSPYGYKQTILQTGEGNGYFVWNVNFNGYSYGFFIPISRMMDLLKESLSDVGDIYITDEAGTILSASGGQTGNVSAYEHGMQRLEMKPYGIDAQLIRLIPEGAIHATIPVFERVLQNLALAALIMIPVLWFSLRRLVIQPMNRLNTAMKELEQDNLEYRMKADEALTHEFSAMSHSFNRMAAQIKELRIQKYETEIEKLKVETLNLRLQVNPHLLLNSLNMICSLAKLKEYQTIKSYTMNLAEYFRYSLRKTDDLVPLSSEMRFVSHFLDMQKVRFPGAFTSVYEIDERLGDMCIPPLLIQNFVENSVKYALKMGSTIEIIILITKEEDNAVLSIIDTGNGMELDMLKRLNQGEIIENKTGKHIGIWNVRRRLHLFYGEDVVLTINSAPGEGTQVWMKIPIGIPGKGGGR